MQVRFVDSENLDYVEVQINQWLDKGWALGGDFITLPVAGSTYRFIQRMVKYDDVLTDDPNEL